MPVVTKEQKKKRQKQKQEGPKDVRTPAQVAGAKSSAQDFLRQREKLRNKEGLSEREATKRITFREKQEGPKSFEQVPVQPSKQPGPAIETPPETKNLEPGKRTIIPGAFTDPQTGQPMPGLSETEDEATRRERESIENLITVGVIGGAATPGAVANAPKVIKDALGFLKGGRTASGKRAMVGNSEGYIVRDISQGRNFATNTKSISLTKKILIGLGLGVAAASLAVNAISTYPFAKFLGKEEAAQTYGIVIWQAMVNGDLEGAQVVIDQQLELINAKPTIVDKIPWANTAKAVDDNIDAVRDASVEWQRILDILKGEAERG